MELLRNPWRGRGLPEGSGLAAGAVSADPAEPLALLARCPAAAATPLRDLPALAEAFGVGALRIKDESGRMGLGSFKALGAAYVLAREAAALADPADREAMARALAGRTYCCASAGNHGLSVATGARLFGGRSVIFLSETVPEAFAGRLRRAGAEVRRDGADYEASMAAAAVESEAKGWTLLSDSSWPGYLELPARVMEGYLVAAQEAADALSGPPSHVFLQAGVGGFAAAMAALFRARWGDGPTLVVVEPASARCLLESVRAGRPVRAPGPASIMGRLDCKEASHLALGELAHSADVFVTLDDEACAATVALLAAEGLRTTPSGAAGVAALQHAGARRAALGLDAASRVLAFMTEGPEDAS
ncbi:diaminopropionate ammonia-lyase [Tistlia consotensis]|uniref:Diaminopropionate ammonia-lyase n=1 Tax=Tistlia consotensis USBA 355 TaxID=560819 RepID=A0A1Y6C8H6_9PROT|nr:diaminopropionate ammonia-lyase [Tistlia consotensis]SMF51524.1 diaminopropionate ammonia-lyase [Tistlia consotensis USBA 355]SNR84094.1 diaminopropionate ammonia-lyase [Tistlia consotensis]